MTRDDIEIMAPAGNFDCLIAAIQGGANSVYFGVGELNMRSRSANNFTLADLPEISRLCADQQIKSYLTVNTVLFDNDLPAMYALIDAAADAKISAIIASDQAAIMYASSKKMEIHLSTQINISNYASLKFYAAYADVAVLARELSMDQVAYIYHEIQKDQLCGPNGSTIRLEMFAHGALCMATSGKCYLSLHQYNSSANRGSCLQNCRRSYVVTDKETGNELEIDNEYIMSAKDLCTIEFMDKMIDAGVRVFKIEGRARSAEYVKTVSQCYHQAALSIVDGTYTDQQKEIWKTKLSTVFNRGFWGGYYLGKTLGEWTEKYGNKATTTKIHLGKVTNYFANSEVAEILIEAGELVLTDQIIITGPTTGVAELVVSEIRVDLKVCEKAIKGDKCSLKISDRVRRGDKVYLIRNA